MLFQSNNLGFEITVFLGFSNINTTVINRNINIILITTPKLNNTLVKNKKKLNLNT